MLIVTSLLFKMDDMKNRFLFSSAFQYFSFPPMPSPSATRLPSIAPAAWWNASLPSVISPVRRFPVSVNGEIVWSEGFGYADLEQQVPVYPDKTRFRIGSVSKPLTARCSGRALRCRKVNLDAPIQGPCPNSRKRHFHHATATGGVPFRHSPLSGRNS